MDYKNINHLLEKYWEGETSLQEEETLQQYFNNGSVKPEHEEFKSLFAFFKEEKEITVSNDFEKRFLEKIEQAPTSKPAIVKKLNWSYTIRTIAAIGIILLGAVFLIKNFSEPTENLYAGRDNVKVINDEKEAYEATKAALLLLSGKMKKGAKKATKGLQEVKHGSHHAKKLK